MNKRTAVFPGSFDPPTIGHIDLINRASAIFDRLYILIGTNIRKNTMFSIEERTEILCEISKRYENVSVCSWNGLICDFCKKNDIGIIIRGLRAETDFQEEFYMAQTNKTIAHDIETIFLPADPSYTILRSSTVKELYFFGADVSDFVPDEVLSALNSKNS